MENAADRFLPPVGYHVFDRLFNPDLLCPPGSFDQPARIAKDHRFI